MEGEIKKSLIHRFILLFYIFKEIIARMNDFFEILVSVRMLITFLVVESSTVFNLSVMQPIVFFIKQLSPTK